MVLLTEGLGRPGRTEPIASVLPAKTLVFLRIGLCACCFCSVRFFCRAFRCLRFCRRLRDFRSLRLCGFRRFCNLRFLRFGRRSRRFGLCGDRFLHGRFGTHVPIHGIGDPDKENRENRPQNDAGDLLSVLFFVNPFFEMRLLFFIAIYFFLTHVFFLPLSVCFCHSVPILPDSCENSVLSGNCFRKKRKEGERGAGGQRNRQ